MTGKNGVYWANQLALSLDQGLQSCSTCSSVCFDVVWLSKMEYIELSQVLFYARI